MRQLGPFSAFFYQADQARVSQPSLIHHIHLKRYSEQKQHRKEQERLYCHFQIKIETPALAPLRVHQPGCLPGLELQYSMSDC